MTAEHKIKLQKLAAIVVVVFLLYLVVHFTNKKQPPTLPVPVVTVSKPKLANVVDYVNQTGNLVAYNSVNLVARVEGYLNEIKFTDGALVKKGQELFIIEPQPYLEKLRAEQASLEAIKAASVYDLSEYKRQQKMYKENATAQKSVEQWRSKYDESIAEIAKAEANVSIAQINYSYTRVLAPFDGRIGRHLVDPGNLVGNGKATELANVEQIDPIYVYFNLNELDLLKLRAEAKAHGITREDINKIPVYVAMQNEKGFPHQGKLDFVNTGLNASTGTMQFRALLPNKDLTLLPGLFVQVRIAASNPKPTLTVPDSAVLYDQIGAYLLTVDNNNTVAVKRVKLGGVENGMRAVISGLSAQDNVIVDGLQNATPGKQVNPQTKKETTLVGLNNILPSQLPSCRNSSFVQAKTNKALPSKLPFWRDSNYA
ncbi:efflux RND transporter periplasmic adaptor subunit [Legionella dresdenensis]|uniref:Efflux RND transporter periplasmic adaptor subunit n=1 Tax=Legionella dresdenensis TaxID=450200 RepID=A0ABV8CCS2_9GAMM